MIKKVTKKIKKKRQDGVIQTYKVKKEVHLWKDNRDPSKKYSVHDAKTGQYLGEMTKTEAKKKYKIIR